MTRSEKQLLLRKDPTDFRNRFQAWKNGIPAYEDGKPLSFGDKLTNAANEVAMWLGIDRGSIRRFTSDINNITRSLGLSADVQRDEYGRMYASPSVAAAPALTNAFSTYAGKYLSEVGSKATRATRQYKQRFGDLLDLDLLTNRQINAAMYGRRKEVQAIKQRHAEYDRFPNYGDRDINIREDGTPIGHMAVSIDHGYIVPDFLSKTIDGIRSNAKGISRDAYSAGAEIARQSGFKGVKSGEHLLSPEKTTPAYRDFDTEVIANNGLRDNSGIVGNLKPYAVHNAEDAAKIAKQGKRYVWNGAPVVNLTKPKHFIPTKDLDMFDPRILDVQGNMHIDLNSRDIFRTMLPFAIGGGLWGHSNKYKNGKDLPRFKDGTRYLWDDLTNSWDRITDSDTANMMANWAFTPTTTRAKFDYENNPNYTRPINKNEAIVPDNTLWTRQNVEKANNNRTWMSDVADALHPVNQVTDFLPVIGDIKLGLEAGVAAAKGDYLTAGMLGGMLLLPNIADNAVKKTIQYFKPLTKSAKKMNGEDYFNMLFDRHDVEGGGPYFTVKPEYRDRITIKTIGDTPYGYDVNLVGSKIKHYRGLPESIKRGKFNEIVPVFKDELSIPREFADPSYDAGLELIKDKFYDETYIRDNKFPEAFLIEDAWVKGGKQGPKPILMDYDKFEKLSDVDLFNMFFGKHVDPYTGSEYYMPYPQWRGIVKPSSMESFFKGPVTTSGVNVNIKIPKQYRSNIATDESEVPVVLGYKKVPVTKELTPPKMQPEVADWSDYRDEVRKRIRDDWDNNGALASHLKRSGINNPDVLLKYIVSPEQAWKDAFQKPKNISDMFTAKNVKNIALSNNEFAKSYLTSQSEILKRNGLDPKALLINNGMLDVAPDVLSYADELSDVYRIDKDKAKDIVNAAINDVLNRDTAMAKVFYTGLDNSFFNAYASRYRANMYVPLNNQMWPEVASHEFGHLEDAWTDRSTAGVSESSQVAISPKSDSALFKKAFDLNTLDRRTREYFSNPNDNDATEMAQRATQLADYFRLKPGLEFTPEMLKYAMEHYTDDVMNNNMKEFFSSIKDIKAAAKWINVHHKAFAPFVIGTATAGSVLRQPDRSNKKHNNE